MRPVPFRLPFICLALVCLAFALSQAGCNKPEEKKEKLPEYSDRPALPLSPPYRFAVHPQENVKRVFAAYSPLAALLKKECGTSSQLIVPLTYDDFERRLRERMFDIALADPSQVFESLDSGYRVLASAGDRNTYRGLIIVRRDTNIHDVRDLAGRPLSFSAPSAFASTLLPKAFLHENGLDLHSCPMRYVGSETSALMSVYFGKTAAAGTQPRLWKQFREEHPEIAASLMVRWATDPFVTDAVIIHTSVPEKEIARIRAQILGLHETPEGRNVLNGIGISKFEPSTTEEYLQLARFMQKHAEAFSLAPQSAMQKGAQ